MGSVNNCTDVGPGCPVELSIYGYYPSLAANTTFLCLFGVGLGVSLGLGLWYKTWFYSIAVSLGCLTEIIGYVGRLIMRSNPFGDGFIVQICCLIIAPAFNSAAIYLTLKHITLCFGAESSLIKPKNYTYIFITADLVSLVLQAVGGAMASTANTSSEEDTGNDIMLAGICWQVVSLFFFAVVSGLYAWRRWKALPQLPLNYEATITLHDIKFQLFAFGVCLSWLTIFIRCVYRIVEMAGGWSNTIMRDETDFIILEGVYVPIIPSRLLPTDRSPQNDCGGRCRADHIASGLGFS